MIKEQGSFVRECGENYGSYGNGYGHDSTRGKANAGLTLGIIGTVLGAAALWGRGNNGIGNLLGGGSAGGGVPTNVNIRRCILGWYASVSDESRNGWFPTGRFVDRPTLYVN